MPAPLTPPACHCPRTQAAEAADVERILSELGALPKGAKKPVSPDGMFKAYHPKMVEAAWYDW